MHVLALFVSFILAANGSFFPLFDGSLPDDSLFDPNQEKLDAAFMEDLSGPESQLDLGGFFDDPNDPASEQAFSNSDEYGSDVGSSYLIGTMKTNDVCESDDGDGGVGGLQPSRQKKRAEGFCSTDQKDQIGQQDTDSENSTEGSIINELPNDDETSPMLDGIPLVDFRSINRNIGYCPKFFYDPLGIPVCGSADPADITKTPLNYYNLNHAMRRMIISSYLFFLFLSPSNPSPNPQMLSFRRWIPHWKATNNT